MYKVKYYVTDVEGNEVESATTYTNEDFGSYVDAANWLREESEWFVEACTIDTKNNPECVEVADDLKVVRIAPRLINEPIREIPLLAGIEIESATQKVLEVQNDFHFRFEGSNYQWTQFIGEREHRSVYVRSEHCANVWRQEGGCTGESVLPSNTDGVQRVGPRGPLRRIGRSHGVVSLIGRPV